MGPVFGCGEYTVPYLLNQLLQNNTFSLSYGFIQFFCRYCPYY